MAAINELKLNEKSLDAETGKFKELKHYDFVIGPDMEMDRRIQLTWYENDNGVPGIPTLQAISADSTLHPLKKERLADQFRTRIIPTTTRGKMVDPVTGQRVYPNAEGAYPVGAISQLEFWQNMPRVAMVQNDDGTIRQSVYAALVYDLQDTLNNGAA